jgi:streptomycin 6-kinase
MVPDQSLDVPASFARRMHEIYGPSGDAWLQALPALAAGLAARWQLTLGAPFALSFNYVCTVRRADSSEAVLKVGYPHHELEREIAAVRLYAGEGMCRLLEADETRFAMLLERLRPGETLVDLSTDDDEAATRIGAEVMRRLWRPVPPAPAGAAFEPIAAWFERAFAKHRAEYGGPGPFPAAIFERGEVLAAELLASAPSTMLLHGDFHHYNVLSAERAPWLAIDPKGMTGDPGYEVGPFLLNPRPGDALHPSDRLRRRLDIFAEELAYDRRRLRDWGIAHAVLSACWSAEGDGQGWQKAIATAETLLDLD